MDESCDSDKKRVITVLASPRNGTSVITRGLQAAGVSLGSHMLTPDERNPTGFWEDVEINYKINQGVLRELDYPWICQGLSEVMQAGSNLTLNAYKRFAVGLVRQRLRQLDCWGFKDPNTVCVLPFWEEVFREADVQDSYVFALRNPLDCAYSNIKHSHLDLEAGLLVWLRGLMLGVQGTHGKTRMVVSYDVLLKDPAKQVDRMHAQLKLTNQLDDSEKEIFARKFIANGLHHHRHSEQELLTHKAMLAVPLCLPVYQLLLRIANDELSFTDAEFHAAWQPIRREFENQFPLYNELHSIRKACHRLQKDIHKIQHSFIWKALAPFRRHRVIEAGKE